MYLNYLRLLLLIVSLNDLKSLRLIKMEISELIGRLFSGNPLSCDCRLSWIYVLRNATKDNALKYALEKISCFTDSTVERRLNDQEDIETSNENVLTGDNYDYYDKNEDYAEKKAKTKAKKLTDIPLDTLPCPKELMQTIEESYGHPVQNEIRLKYSAVGRNAPCFILYLMLVLLLF